MLRSGAGARVAFVPAHTGAPRLAETLTALANAHGGVVLLGVTANGQTTGLQNADAARALVETAGLLSSPPLILPLPQFVEQAGKQLCLVEVPPGLPHVFSLDGRYLTRTHALNRLLSPSELSSLLLERGEAGFESRPVPDAALDDLDPNAIHTYLDALGAPAGGAWTKVLLARGCLTQTPAGLTPTYAGMLLFGRQPQRFLHNAEIILVRYPGPVMQDEFLRHDAAGTLPDQIRQAEAFVAANMRRGMKIRGFTREETAEYPISVVREAIVNAVAHRDYAIRGEGIRVLMFSDHLEVYSPGRLPGHVTLDNLIHERFSRNEAIVQALSDLGFVERLGYGIDRMVAAMAEAELPPPVFEETVAGFRVTLRGRGDDLVSHEPGQRWGNRRLTPRQEAALAYLVERGSITNREFRELAPDVSDETIRRDLADLVDQGLIMRIGDRRATYYILK
ncbi:MAG: transcriptional regulator [Chloroflexi bacterium HGW-Chloroflexi-1]|nr:MAG: transcriptional regulator [Chloroflexi bacterium HGW-Chloroflexi-1]